MSNKIPGRLCVNVEKVGREWIVELYWPDIYAESVWIAKDKDKAKALGKAQAKLIRATERLYEIEFPGIKKEFCLRRKIKV